MKVEHRKSKVEARQGQRGSQPSGLTQPSTFNLQPRRRAGILLVECLVYIAVFAVIMTLAFGALYRTWTAHKTMRRNADDIAAALKAGEQWRADIRHAIAPPEQLPETDGPVVIIPCLGDSVVYRFGQDAVTRETTTRPAPMVVLRNVRSSNMSVEARTTVTAWRWELELKTTRPNAKLRPLFTFTAVPTGAKP